MPREIVVLFVAGLVAVAASLVPNVTHNLEDIVMGHREAGMDLRYHPHDDHGLVNGQPFNPIPGGLTYAPRGGGPPGS